MEKIENKFIRYAKIDTESSETSSTYPSTSKQLNLAKLLKEELTSLGVEAYIDEYGLVYAHIDGDNTKPKIGLIAHMDTAPTIQGGNFEPRIIKNYDGKDIILNEKYTLSNKQFPHLKSLINKDLIVTDGEHLLGGDDKAGIAIIMSIVEYYQTHKDINHAPIRICFTPDEEIGAGADHFSTTKMDADVAYTVDGGNYNEINIENFNASSAEVIIKGVGIHPGEAKDIMVNAILLAMEFNSLLNPNAIPSKTSGKEGFNHLENISGDVEECKMSYILRNHDDILLKEQEQSLLTAKEIIERKYPTCKIHVHIKEQYKNMVYYFEKDDKAVKLIQKAFNKCKKEYEFVAVRGGTDGARITYMGLPCPNIGTGDRCCHGRYEHVVINELYEMFEIITTLLEL